jgi:hypothetical protein
MSPILYLLGRAIKSRQLIRSFPLHWDGHSLSISDTTFSRVNFYIGFIHSILYAVHLFNQLGSLLSHSINADPKKYVDFLWVMLWYLYYIWAVVMYSNYITKSKELLAFFYGLAMMYERMLSK